MDIFLIYREKSRQNRPQRLLFGLKVNCLLWKIYLNILAASTTCPFCLFVSHSVSNKLSSCLYFFHVLSQFRRLFSYSSDFVSFMVRSQFLLLNNGTEHANSPGAMLWKSHICVKRTLASLSLSHTHIHTHTYTDKLHKS